MPSSTGRRGRPWADHRCVAEAIVYRYRTGIPWRDIPAGFASWKTAWARHGGWAADGTWDRVLGVLLVRADDGGLIDWRVAWILPSPGPTSTPPTPAAPRSAGPQPKDRASTAAESPPGTRSAVPAAG
ncbi:transposase [Streptomyces sp. NPDC016640]|uniref:transposase n=1 Tax=Streptomyces sp. NPDC016640 TaxID=3364969 RepID=UPI0036F661DB